MGMDLLFQRRSSRSIYTNDVEGGLFAQDCIAVHFSTNLTTNLTLCILFQLTPVHL